MCVSSTKYMCSNYLLNSYYKYCGKKEKEILFISPISEIVVLTSLMLGIILESFACSVIKIEQVVIKQLCILVTNSYFLQISFSFHARSRFS